jgi:hypothetical protein
LIRYRDLVRINVMPYWNLVRQNARLAAIGGRSQIRAEQRQGMLLQDQLVGQAGEIALSLYMFGNPLAYTANRAERNANPHRGDQGTDVPGGNVDVKASCLKEGTPWSRYHLYVRDRELHPQTVYVLALVEGIPSVLTPVMVEVRLIGWVSTADLIANATIVSAEGRSRRGLQAPLLNPLMPLKWATTGQSVPDVGSTAEPMCV